MKECAVGLQADRFGEKLFEIGVRHPAEEVPECVGETPTFDKDVEGSDHGRQSHAEGTGISHRAAAGNASKNTGGRVKFSDPGVASDGPFRPSDGESEKQKGDKVGDHERSAAV